MKLTTLNIFTGGEGTKIIFTLLPPGDRKKCIFLAPTFQRVLVYAQPQGSKIFEIDKIFLPMGKSAFFSAPDI